MGKKRMEQLNYIDIFREFDKNKIQYIVCGGIAVNLLGIPRMTYDVDLLLNMEDDNLRKFFKLLKKWGFKPKVPVDIMDFALKENREKWINEKNMKAFNLYNDKWAISEIDILIDVPINYKRAIKQIVYKKVGRIIIPVISINHLIKMKQNTNRKQDAADIKYLKGLK